MISESPFNEIKSQQVYTSVNIKVQDYYGLRDKCLTEDVLFEDNTFPANNFAITGDDSGKATTRGTLEWLRPSAITDSPVFLEGDTRGQRFDVNQGDSGNCWLLAAVANLTLNKKLFDRVVKPEDNNDTLGSGFKAGIFHFSFWQFGKWIDVVIDDRLPTVNKKLLFMHSRTGNHFWGALLEKAYAKLYGSYAALNGGTAGEAMEDFTGGLTETFNLRLNKSWPTNLLQIMLKANERNSLMSCSITPENPSDIGPPSEQQQLPNGLVTGHAYSVTDVILLELKTSIHPDKSVKQDKPLVRVRNPWGNDAEWKGAWSDRSREWDLVADDKKKELTLKFESDGEFWMSFDDFQTNFTTVEICNLTPDDDSDPDDDRVDVDEDGKRWEVYKFDGSWIRGITAGGCRNNLETFDMNPQYVLTLVDCDDDSDELCTCVVSLMQKNQRSKRSKPNAATTNLSIGFAIYSIYEEQVDSSVQYMPQKLLTKNFFRYNESIARSLAFIDSREVNGRFRLKPGKYCIIPSTFYPNEEADFLLRIFTEKCASDVAENDNNVGVVVPDKDKIVARDKFRSDLSLNTLKDDENSFFNLFTYCWTGFSAAKNSGDRETETLMRTENIKQVDSAVSDKFEKVGGDEEAADASQVENMLNQALKKQFNLKNNRLYISHDTCKSLLAMLDSDRDGRLVAHEFIQLWKNVRQWCVVFRKHDVHHINKITADRLRAAFQEIGFRVNRSVLRSLVLRYGVRVERPASTANGKTKTSNAAKRIACLSFDEFVRSAIKLKKCVDIWTAKQKNESFSFDEFVESMIYCSL